MASRAGSVLGFIFIDLAGSFVRFPIWWYTTGLLETARSFQVGLGYSWRSLGISLWFKNFFVPMYGADDFWGRVISVLMRFVVITGRFVYFMLEVGIALLAMFAWIVAPIGFFWLFLRSLYIGSLVTRGMNFLP